MRQRPKKDFGLVVAITCSLLAHVAFFTAFSFLAFFSPRCQPNAAPVYYVDMVNLPVANPRAGSPSERGSDAGSRGTCFSNEHGVSCYPPARNSLHRPLTGKYPNRPLTGKQPSRRPKPKKSSENALPAWKRRSKGDKPQAPSTNFGKRLPRAAAGRGCRGERGRKPEATTAATSSHGLRDAFEKTIASGGRNPMVVVRLTIDQSRQGNRLPYRADVPETRYLKILLLGRCPWQRKTFPPPPGRREFQQGFIFKPEGVGKK